MADKIHDSLLYEWYLKLSDNRIVATVAGLFYTKLRPLFQKQPVSGLSEGNPEFPVTAFICDEMTWQDFKLECPAFYLTPKNWKKSFKERKPDLLFCESTWAGITQYHDCWRGRFYQSDRLLYNNRRELFQIVAYCKENGIPTVFWNKEDPLYFEDRHYNFANTALHFDHILTTTDECIPKYHELGHESAHLWMFGAAPRIFHAPEPDTEKENAAVFAGSWYPYYADRCRDTERVFDMVLEKGIELRIYDRQMYMGKGRNRFPAKYERYVRKPVKFEELGDIYRRAKYIININTVTDSHTMFARRVFEAMACGCVVISNHSDGLKNMFGPKIWFLDEPFDDAQWADITRENMTYVLQNHTCGQRWAQLNTLLKTLQ